MTFIVLDGLDASGKDTQAQLLKERYYEDEDVIIRSHPCPDNLFGNKADEALKGDCRLSRIQATFYFTLDVINSLLRIDDRAKTVIFVRYLCSVAYLPDPLVDRAYRLLSSVLPTSTYMFYLDIDPENAIDRLKNRDERQIFENKNDLKKVRERALSIVEDWHVIDSSRPVEDVYNEIKKVLDSSS